MKKYFISVFFCFLAITLFSQVRGVVKDQNGSVLIGANVVWIGTNYGTSTDANGSFVLERRPNMNTIVVSFVGFDNDGQARYAGLRSTGDRQFKGDATGSRKDYSFRITNDIAGEAHLFEAAVDLLSYATLMEMHNLDFRSVNLCALAGVAVPGAGGKSEIPPAIRTLLDGRKIDTIYFHLDNDEVGIASAKALAQTLKERGYKTFIQPVPKERGKDVNDMLQSILTEKGPEYGKGKKM